MTFVPFVALAKKAKVTVTLMLNVKLDSCVQVTLAGNTGWGSSSMSVLILSRLALSNRGTMTTVNSVDPVKRVKATVMGMRTVQRV
jgi:hypothetical protein